MPAIKPRYVPLKCGLTAAIKTYKKYEDIEVTIDAWTWNITNIDRYIELFTELKEMGFKDIEFSAAHGYYDTIDDYNIYSRRNLS